MAEDRKSRIASLAAKAGRNLPTNDTPAVDDYASSESKPTISFRNYVPKDANLSTSTPTTNDEGQTSSQQQPSTKRLKPNTENETHKSALEKALAKTSQESREAAGQSAVGGWSAVTPVAPKKINWDLKRDIMKIRRNLSVSWLNVVSFFYSSMATVLLYVFMSAVTGYVLTSIVPTPTDKQGAYAGDLLFVNEGVVLLTIHLWGFLSDLIGRRYVWALGFMFMAAGCTFYPFATSFEVLILIRVLYAIGASASSSVLAAVLADVILPEDRGKAAGMMGFATGLGAVLAVFIFLKVPSWLTKTFTEFDPIWNTVSPGELMFWSVSAFCIISGIFAFFSLPRNVTAVERPPALQIFIQGARAAKNPVMMLAYMAGFAARGDSVVASTFLSLWVTQAALAAGKSQEDALAYAGTVSGVAQTCALLFGPVIGLISDRYNRILGFTLASVIGAVGYLMTAFQTDVFSNSIFIGASLLGCGEIGLVVTSVMLVAQESPKEARGVCSGFWGFCGSVGIIVSTLLGGYLYDYWMEGAPFFIFGVVNVICAVAGLLVWFFHLKHPLYNVSRNYEPINNQNQKEPE